MPKFAITGHMNLTARSIPLIYQALREALAPYVGGELVGISCIARGADSIFAQVVLDVDGKLEVLLPASNYRRTKVNEALVSSCDRLFAVWDGRTSMNKGSTASVVEYARSLGVPVEVVWPDGAERE